MNEIRVIFFFVISSEDFFCQFRHAFPEQKHVKMLLVPAKMRLQVDL